MPRRIYIETSVWGMMAPGQVPERAEPTRRFFRRVESGEWLPCVSQLVLMEVSKVPIAVQTVVSDSLAAVDPQVLPLARRFVVESVVPPRRLEDATHVACALVHACDLLVSWDLRHIANVHKAEQFNAVAVSFGLTNQLKIHTPAELLNANA